MEKSILDCLLNDEYSCFREGLIDFLKTSTTVEDLTEYSFLPIFFDSWLLSAKEKSHFLLYKIYRPGKLVYDITTYIIVPNSGDKIYYVTLNNVYHRDKAAEDELIQEDFFKKNTLNKRKKSSPGTGLYQNLFKEYTDLTLKYINGKNEEERSAKVALLLQQNKVRDALENLIREGKNIKYVGIAGVRGELDVQSGSTFHQILKKITITSKKHRGAQKVTADIRTAMAIKNDQFILNTLESIKLPSDLNTNSYTTDSLFDENFHKQLDFIVSQHAYLSKARTRYEINLSAAITGYIAAKNLKVIAKRKAELERKARVWHTFRHVNDYMYYDEELKQAMPKPNSGIAHVVDLKFIDRAINKGLQQAYDFTNYNRYARNFNRYYDVMRVERIAIVASRLNYHTTIIKDIASVALPIKARISLTKLLLKKDFVAFEHNLNLFAQSVLDIKDIKSRHPEFIPAFILGLLFEGVLQKNLDFYVQPLRYDEYSFLVESNATKELILLTNAENINQIDAILSKFDKQISLLSKKNNVSNIRIIQLNIKKEQFNLIVSENKIEPILTFKSMEALSFTKDNLQISACNPFNTILYDLTYNKDINKAIADLDSLIERLFLRNWDSIFPFQRLTHSYVSAGLLGLVAASWQNFFTLESDGKASEPESFYLNITPSFKNFRKTIPTEIEPRSLTFIFQWNELGNLQKLRDEAKRKVEERKKKSYSSELKFKKFFRNQSTAYLVIATSKTNVVTQLIPEDSHAITPYQVADIKRLREESADNAEIKKTCKAYNFAACKKNIQKKKIENKKQEKNKTLREAAQSLKEIIHYPNLHNILDIKNNQLIKDLTAVGAASELINLLKIHADQKFEMVGSAVLEEYYKYISEDKEQSYLIKHKEHVKFKLKKWFNFSTLYSILDNIVTIKQNTGPGHSLIHTGLVVNDLGRTLVSFLSQRAIEYKTTRFAGYHLKKFANNPLTRLISFTGNQYQLVSGFYSIENSILGNGTTPDFTTLYWTGRSIMVDLGIITKKFQKLNLSFAIIDILVSSLAHIGSGFSAVYSVANHLPLSTKERVSVFFDYIFGYGLSKFEKKISIKYQLTHLKHSLQNFLINSKLRGVIIFADRLEMKQHYSKVAFIGKDSPFFPETFFLPAIGEDYLPGNISHTLKIGSIREYPKFNLSAVTTRQFLPMHDAYLGLTTNTYFCLLAVSFFCNVNLELKFMKRVLLWFLETLQGTPCQFLNNTQVTGNEDACQLRQRLENDITQRKIKVIDNVDLVMPTQLQNENRFAWVSLPLGSYVSLSFDCQNVASIESDDGFAPRALGDKICSETFVFRNGSPYSLIDTIKPVDAPVLYLNAPTRLFKNVRTTQLQVMQSNPAIIHVDGEYINYNGSMDFYNVFILNNFSNINDNISHKIRGYVQGGGKNDTFLVGSFIGALSLIFVGQFKSPTNKTLHVINIESYFGSNQVEEDLQIDYCGLRNIDAKGSLGQPDRFVPNDQLRCNETDTEERRVYAGDIHYLPSHKPIILQLNSSNFDKPAFLIKSSIPTVYPPIVLLNVSLINLTISALNEPEDIFSGEYAYRITTDQGKTLLKTNSFEPLYLTLEEVHFSVQRKSLQDLQNLIIQQVLSQNLTTPINKFTNNATASLESINIVLTQPKNTLMNFPRLKKWMSTYVNKFSWQMKRFTATNALFETVIFGSYFNDIFTTELDHFSYWFHGGEGSDEYKILAGDSRWQRYPDFVVINNHALIYNTLYGQDILNISPLEHYNPELKIIEIEKGEETRLGLNNQTLVLLIEYDNLIDDIRSKVKIFLQEYHSNEDFRHLLLKLSSHPNHDVLYRINLNNQKLMPEYYSNEVPIDVNGLPIPITQFPSISIKKENLRPVSFFNQTNSRSEILHSLNLTDLKIENSNASILASALTFEEHKTSQATIYPIASKDQINFKALYETDREYREILGGDIVYINNYPPVIFQLKSINFDRPVVLVKTRVTSYPQIILLDVSFWALTVRKLEQAAHFSSGPIYQILIDPDMILLSTNATDKFIYVTRERIAFYLTTSAVSNQQKLKIREEFSKSLVASGSLSYDKPLMEDTNFVVHYVNNDCKSQKELRALLSKMVYYFTWQLQSFTINNLPHGIMQAGSVYNDTFLTYEMNLAYEFYGGEGVDLYQILPSEKTSQGIDRILINNQALIHNNDYGQDILDLTKFKFLRPRLTLQEPDDWERSNFDINEQSIVLQIHFLTNITNTVRVCIRDYLDEQKGNVLFDNQNNRHLLIKLATVYSGLDVLYWINIEKKQLIPLYVVQNILDDENENIVNMSNPVMDFQPILLSASSEITNLDLVSTSDLQKHLLHVPELKTMTLISKKNKNVIQNSNSFGIYLGGITLLLGTFYIITAYLRRPTTIATYSSILVANTLRSTITTPFLMDTVEAIDSSQLRIALADQQFNSQKKIITSTELPTFNSTKYKNKFIDLKINLTQEIKVSKKEDMVFKFLSKKIINLDEIIIPISVYYNITSFFPEGLNKVYHEAEELITQYKEFVLPYGWMSHDSSHSELNMWVFDKRYKHIFKHSVAAFFQYSQKNDGFIKLDGIYAYQEKNYIKPFKHEFMHALLAGGIGWFNFYKSVPRWFHEGLSELAQYGLCNEHLLTILKRCINGVFCENNIKCAEVMDKFSRMIRLNAEEQHYNYKDNRALNYFYSYFNILYLRIQHPEFLQQIIRETYEGGWESWPSSVRENFYTFFDINKEFFYSWIQNITEDYNLCFSNQPNTKFKLYYNIDYSKRRHSVLLPLNETYSLDQLINIFDKGDNKFIDENIKIYQNTLKKKIKQLASPSLNVYEALQQYKIYKNDVLRLLDEIYAKTSIIPIGFYYYYANLFLELIFEEAIIPIFQKVKLGAEQTDIKKVKLEFYEFLQQAFYKTSPPDRETFLSWYRTRCHETGFCTTNEFDKTEKMIKKENHFVENIIEEVNPNYSSKNELVHYFSQKNAPQQVTDHIAPKKNLHHQVPAVSASTRANSWINQGFAWAKNFFAWHTPHESLSKYIRLGEPIFEDNSPLPSKLKPQTFPKFHNQTRHSHFSKTSHLKVGENDTPHAHTTSSLPTAVDYSQLSFSNNLLFFAWLRGWKLRPAPIKKNNSLSEYKKLLMQALQKQF